MGMPEMVTYVSDNGGSFLGKLESGWVTALYAIFLLKPQMVMMQLPKKDWQKIFMPEASKVWNNNAFSNITEMLIGQRREYFFLNFACCFSATMASRFEIVDEEYIEELRRKSDE